MDPSSEISIVEAEPSIAREVFGDRIGLARRFTAALVDQGEVRGLIGPLELPRLWTRHVINCALAAPLLHGAVTDVGSGAGLPGIVLAIVRPDVSFTLVEPMERRTDWLQEQASDLGLSNVIVLRARAEEAPRAAADIVTARAVGALTKLIPIAAPLARRGGELLLFKGATVDAEVAKAQRAIARARLADVRVEELGTGMATEGTRVFRATVN
ncbi:16S rRNA (guanine(527)-N(7))-methyltransferase RsmG [Naasia lichenicola]|uniref:Ribosomal RNA small subunit methyltransferase G n=1 Tax=Naasia lichenicola TaxID=2565933 RepID=A0A4V3WSU4_9MICO|nr:16S rRNA (guanine(527)-N(7))-methyltransferase RsmG [Naasia lichenicola]THG29467.1 16S rRNA (guanine(527)-N(7))-methyltransferase RsmG [Naasia lichenicola]